MCEAFGVGQCSKAKKGNNKYESHLAREATERSIREAVADENSDTLYGWCVCVFFVALNSRKKIAMLRRLRGENHLFTLLMIFEMWRAHHVSIFIVNSDEAEVELEVEKNRSKCVLSMDHSLTICPLLYV